MIFMLLNHATWHVPLISFRLDFGWDTLLLPLAFFTPYMGVGLSSPHKIEPSGVRVFR